MPSRRSPIGRPHRIRTAYSPVPHGVARGSDSGLVSLPSAGAGVRSFFTTNPGSGLGLAMTHRIVHERRTIDVTNHRAVVPYSPCNCSPASMVKCHHDAYGRRFSPPRKCWSTPGNLRTVYRLIRAGRSAVAWAGNGGSGRPYRPGPAQRTSTAGSRRIFRASLALVGTGATSRRRASVVDDEASIRDC